MDKHAIAADSIALQVSNLDIIYLVTGDADTGSHPRTRSGPCGARELVADAHVASINPTARSRGTRRSVRQVTTSASVGEIIAANDPERVQICRFDYLVTRRD